APGCRAHSAGAAGRAGVECPARFHRGCAPGDLPRRIGAGTRRRGRRDAAPGKRDRVMAVRPSADDRKLRAGVVGAGHMGQYHLLAYAVFWALELAGVVDTDRERAAPVAAYYDTRALMDHRDLIGVVGLASVAVPTEQHFTVAADLLEAGVSVLVEKPI